MYATVRELRIQTPCYDEIKLLVRDELIPLARKLSGFVDYYLIDTGQETELSVGLFHSKKGADAFNTVADEWMKSLAPRIQVLSGSDGEIIMDARASSALFA